VTENTADESILSTAVRAHISHAVIAAYVADAVEAAAAGAVLAGDPGKAVRVTTEEDSTVDLELRLTVVAGHSAADAARSIDAAVRRDLQQLVAVPVTGMRIVFEDGG
jgi:uncharacterized alkaline shock family protein YloU